MKTTRYTWGEVIELMAKSMWGSPSSHLAVFCLGMILGSVFLGL